MKKKSKKEKTNFDVYFSGEKLYGDDFSLREINKWFDDEKEGYSSIKSTYRDYYGYHELNNWNGYKYLKNIKKFKNTLGFGSARGEEFIPIADKLVNVTIIEPSESLRAKKLNDISLKYMMPSIEGDIKAKGNQYDLITCFAVLHHIPNVSFVFSELVRVLDHGGFLLIREPIVSMGDWRKRRSGVTKRERGIPLEYFRKLIKKHNLEIISERLVLFPLLRRIEWGNYQGGNSKFWVFIDSIFSKLFSLNYRYHATNFSQKIAPQSVYYVLKKK